MLCGRVSLFIFEPGYCICFLAKERFRNMGVADRSHKSRGRLAFVPDEELADQWPYLTREQVLAFRETFNLFDKDGGGSINVSEIGDVLRALGQKPTKQELAQMVKEVDADGSGDVDFAEFLAMMLRKIDEADVVKELRNVFSVFDKDSSGTIDLEELRTAIRAIGEALTDEDIETCMELADTSGDGEVDYDEFIHFIMREDEDDSDEDGD